MASSSGPAEGRIPLEFLDVPELDILSCELFLFCKVVDVEEFGGRWWRKVGVEVLIAGEETAFYNRLALRGGRFVEMLGGIELTFAIEKRVHIEGELGNASRAKPFHLSTLMYQR